MELGDIEITKRELIVSVAIVFIFMIIGSVISGNITRGSLEDKQKYNTAISIDSENMFDYGMKTNVGNAFCQGQLSAVDTVSDSMIRGEYMYIYKEEQHYNPHIRTVTRTDGKGHTYTTTEVYYSWDFYKSETKHSDKVSFLGKEFDYKDIESDSEFYGIVSGGINIRFEFYIKNTQYDGTLFANLDDKTIHEARFYKSKTIEETREYLTSKANHRVVWFWIVWMLLTIVVVVVFYRADNYWLED